MATIVTNPLYQYPCAGATMKEAAKYPYLTDVSPEELNQLTTPEEAQCAGTTNILVSLPKIPEGWEFDRIGAPNPGEWVLLKDGTVEKRKEVGSTYMSIIVKKSKWRAKKGGHYWTLDSKGQVMMEEEEEHRVDFERYTCWVYEQTKELAQAKADAMRKVIHT